MKYDLFKEIVAYSFNQYVKEKYKEDYSVILDGLNVVAKNAIPSKKGTIYDEHELAKLMTDNGFVGQAWKTGGYSGGGWREDDHAIPYSTQSKKDPNFLDPLLELICPQITYLEYKKLMKNLPVTTGSDTVYEVYQNNTHYDFEYIKIQELAYKLEDMNLMPEESKLKEIRDSIQVKTTHVKKIRK